jgi:hypothetical protein
MKLTCANCAYRNRSIDQWPCDTCHIVGDGNVMTHFIPRGNADESSSCNDDYCEIKFEEE